MSQAIRSYINSTFSIISNAGVRYVGILYSVDPKLGTFALSEVRSYGTEDRPVNVKIGPKDEIFEYIIFKASDIQHLQVCPPEAEYQDPAILTIFPNPPKNDQNASKSSNHTKVSQHQQQPNQSDIASSLSNFSPNVLKSGSSSNEQQRPINNQTKAIPLIHPSELNRNTAMNSKNSSGPPQQSFHNAPSPEVKDSHLFMNNSRRGKNSHFYENNNQRPNQALTQRFDYYQKQNFYRNNYQNYNRGSSGRGSLMNYNRDQQSNYNRYSGDRPNNSGNYRGNPLQYKEDYDFETANATIADELAKMTCNGSNELPIDDIVDFESSNGAAGDESAKTSSLQSDEFNSNQKFYDRTRSFFDTIGSESVDRAKGLPVKQLNRKEENRINQETFGAQIRNQKNLSAQCYYPRGSNNRSRGSRISNWSRRT